MHGINEADTSAKLTDPAIHKRVWTENLIRYEVITAGTVKIIDCKAQRRSRRECPIGQAPPQNLKFMSI